MGEIEIIAAPSHLGLRPPEEGKEPGVWRAPAALLAAGLREALSAGPPRAVGAGVPMVAGDAPPRAPGESQPRPAVPGQAAMLIELPRPPYEFEAQSGTRIRNGHTIREFSLTLGWAVRAAIEAGRFPLVLGGDCSILLGCLYGARVAGGRGLIHVDGHSDFFHPGNYDTTKALGAAAGMDLALATGRGEALLTEWPGIGASLVSDEDAIQIGERDAESPDYDRYYGDIVRTAITRLTIQEVLHRGIPAVCEAVIRRLSDRRLDRAWLHIDLDVLDGAVMPAVDSPGSPGLAFEDLSTLVAGLVESGRVLGADVTIYDPERDPGGIYAGPIVSSLARGFGAAPPKS